jgi:hypothetical protein
LLDRRPAVDSRPDGECTADGRARTFHVLQCLPDPALAPLAVHPHQQLHRLEFLALLLAEDFGRQKAELGDEVVDAKHSVPIDRAADVPCLVDPMYLRLDNEEISGEAAVVWLGFPRRGTC